MSNKSTAYFYHDKPVFGLDIGYGSLKVMQTAWDGHGRPKVIGYGVTSFDPAAIKDGIITDPESLARTVYDLFKKNLIGEITTRRVAVSVPASRTYNRTMSLPKMAAKDIAAAVQLEAEQYIPVALKDLYMDYETISRSDKGTELLAVAVPKSIIDSYVTLTGLLGLEAVTMETTISAAGRLFVQAEESDVPTVLIDLGSLSSDITIFDKALIVTGTVPGGGDNFSNLIAQKLGVTRQEAHVIKTKYGLGLSNKQQEITAGLAPILEQLGKEIRRMIRYYEERTVTEGKIRQVVTMGGGANMPGLSEYLTNMLRLPVRMCDPWQHIDFNDLQAPNNIEKSMYVTVSGLALINPREIFS